MVSRFIQDRLTHDGIKPKTANRIREVLHRMFSYAIEHHGYICPDNKHSNPIKGVKRIKEAAPAITWLTLEQIDEQLIVLENYPTIHVLVSVYIYAGLRREEALWLTSKDVDLNDRLLRIQAKTVNGHYWQPKTKKNRVVPISDSLYRILLAYKSHCDSKWFFPSSKGEMWDPDNFSQKLRKINKEASLDWTSSKIQI